MSVGIVNGGIHRKQCFFTLARLAMRYKALDINLISLCIIHGCSLRPEILSAATWDMFRKAS